MAEIWPGELFGFRSNGRFAIAFQHEDTPPEKTILLGDTISLGGALYHVTSVKPKPGMLFGEGFTEVTAERIPG